MFSAATKTDGASTAVNYVEDVFSTYIYTGNGSSQTITNNIDLSGKGGLVWIKSRSQTVDHVLYDTIRGATFEIASNSVSAQASQATGLTAFNSNGFSVGNLAKINTNAALYASWTFREQSRFFDVVTYTGNGANRTIAHNLGSVPGCIIIKRTDNSAAWAVYHRSLANTQYIVLNTVANAVTGATYWNSTTPTSSVFSLGTAADVNANGGTYVAYLFAHDAGGFGLTGSDNVISCGSFVYSPGTTVNLGYEPQWILFKELGTSDWFIADTTRAWTTDSAASWVAANTNVTEVSFQNMGIAPTSTGFRVPTGFGGGSTYIYIAIRRGPMKTPTTGTSVFQPVVYTGTNVDNRLVNTGLFTDFILARQRNSTTLAGMLAGDRLRGNQYLITGTTAVGVTDADSLMTPTLGYGYSFSVMSGFGCGNDANAQLNVSTVASNQVVEAFARAPGFLDVVTYTGTGVARAINHNLGVKPEMIWIKSTASVAANWPVYSAAATATDVAFLNTTAAFATSNTYFNNTEPTSTQFTVGTNANINGSGTSYVAYLFATVTGVSKVGTYVGTGSLVTVNCGFASGARFVLIKRVDDTGDWWVYDSARGITSGNDPYVLINSSAAEVTSTNYVDTASTGFKVTAAAPIGLNAGYGQFWATGQNIDGINNMWGVAYGNGLYVTASTGGNICYSTTANSWTRILTVSPNQFRGLRFANGVFIAVGASGTICTSTNATSWTTRTSGVSTILWGATYAFGKYWVCGDSGTFISSTDLVTWTAVNIGGTTNALYKVEFLNGNLVIVGGNGTIITSSDGTTFTTRSSGTANDLRSVAYGAGLYVVGGSSSTTRTSPDLVTWTARSGVSGIVYVLIWTGTRFVQGNSTSLVNYSDDGITWTSGASAGTGAFTDATIGNETLVIGNADGNVYTAKSSYVYLAIA